MKYSEIRKYTPREASNSLIDAICITISPLFTSFFLKKNVSPNSITVLMILFGIIGTSFLMLPYLIFKYIGVVCLLLWYVMDSSDGEVARITRRFSKYGAEMDYMAHLICHPLFVIAVWSNFSQLNKYNMSIISLLSLLLISNELIYRNFVSFDLYLNSKKPLVSPGMLSSIKGNMLQQIKYCISQLLYFPNIVVFFPLFLIFDFYSVMNSYYIYFLIVILNVFIGIKNIIRRTIVFYKG